MSMFDGMSDAQIAYAVRAAEKHYLSIGRDPMKCDVALCVLRDIESAPTAEATCTGPNCQGHPHSPECRAEYARSLQPTRSEAMGFDDEVYVAHAVAYLNGLKTKAAKEMADGLLRFLNSHFQLAAQMENKWQPIETAPKDGSRIMLGSRYGVWMAEYRPVAQSGYVFDNPWASMMLNCDHIPLEHRYKAATHWLPLPEPPGGDDGRG